MNRAERELLKMNDEQILDLFRNSTSAYDVCKKLGCKSSNKTVWEVIENIAISKGFQTSEYKQKQRHYCLQCGKELHGWQKKFCSSSCAATYNNVRRERKKSNKYCENCGKLLGPRQYKFCCPKCQRELQYKNLIQEWLSGKNFTVKGGMIPRFIKRYLIELHGNKCERCGWHEANPTTGNVPLEIHHVDGDCYNNRPENLQLLCPNCHSITDNYKALNKNSKREFTVVHK